MTELWFCTHCAKQRPEEPDFKRLDERYTNVVCRTGRETVEGPDGTLVPWTTVPPTRLATNVYEMPLGRLYPGVRTQLEAKTILREARARKRRRTELRAVARSMNPDNKDARKAQR